MNQLRLYLQALLETRAEVAQLDSDAIRSARRLAAAVAARAGAPEPLREAALLAANAPDHVMPGVVNGLLVELRGATGAKRGSGEVLLVDDDPVILRMLELVVRPYARSVVSATSLDEAGIYLNFRRPSAVVLDLLLPDGDGRELLARLQRDRTLESVPVLVVTGQERARVRAECLALGAREVHPKPLDPLSFTHAIAALIGVEEEWILTAENALQEGLDTAAEAAARATALREQYLAAGDHWSVIAVRAHALADLPEVVRTIRAVLGPHGVLCRQNDVVYAVLELDGPRAFDVVDELQTRLEDVSVGGAEGGRASWPEVTQSARRAIGSGLGRPMVWASQELEPGRVRVVVVDDDPVIAALVGAALGPAVDILPLSDGSRLFEALVTRKPDAVILDIDLPGVNGLELLQQLRESPQFAKMRVIILSSYGSPQQVEAGLQAGADDYVVKPLEPVVFRARVRRMLAGER